MSLVAVGLSHHTSPVELRERLHFPEADIPRALLQLAKRLEGAGAVILSTCNRVEIYGSHATLSPRELGEEMRVFMSESRGVPLDDFSEALYVHEEGEVGAHLFRVASSLDSLVVGEGQILGQVHDAFMLAQSAQTADKILSALFQRAFSVAKDVRTHSDIGTGRVSMASVAVDLAVSIFMDLSGKNVMIVGSGKMGQATLRSLVAHGVGGILLTNRSPEKAEELAAQFGGVTFPYEELRENLHRADIVITSTASDRYVLTPADFHLALKKRANEPMFAIDIAVPRDIDPASNDLDNVYLYDVDALQEVAAANLDARREEIAQCMEIVESGVARFDAWLQSLVAEPTIVSLAEELNTLRERELEKTLAALPDMTEQQREEVTYLTKRIVNAILQRPMSQIKREVTHHDPHTVLHIVKRLFGLKEST